VVTSGVITGVVLVDLKLLCDSDIGVDFCVCESHKPLLDLFHDAMKQFIVCSAPLFDPSLHAVFGVPMIEHLDNFPSRVSGHVSRAPVGVMYGAPNAPIISPSDHQRLYCKFLEMI
jgi:hypothetical protein